MKNLLLLLALFIFASARLIAQTHDTASHPTKHVLVNKTDLKWGDGPAALPKGAKMTVVDGDPSKEGHFTLRASFPANYRIAPHWHPSTEYVTVIEGDLYMGTADKIDEQKSTKLSPGGFAVMPAKMVHYAYTKAPVTIQVSAMGPFQIIYVNPADDPTGKQK